ncbi:MAG: creatininase family protein [Ruminococcaceae bacterium]|nr:creatininase family protein [Oscillospiraceae bacterium]
MAEIHKNFMVNMTVKDMQEALKRTKTVIIPVGVVEQHGYHLPLSTDIHNAEDPLRIAGERLNAIVAPTVNYCFSGGELAGTVNVSPQVFGLYMMDICCEFVRMGFKNIVILSGHGGTENWAALRGALQSAMRRTPEMKNVNIFARSSGGFSATINHYFGMEPQHDFHAGLTETSRMMYWAPELVRMDEMELDEKELLETMRIDCDYYATAEKNVDDEFVIPYLHQKPEVKIGVMGFPEKADVEIGKKISDEMVEGIVSYIDMINEKTK